MDNPMQPWIDPSICFSLERSALTVRFRSSRNPLECLLGLPFMCLALTKCQEFLDRSAHLLLMDPTQAHLLLFQPMPSDPAGIILLPVITKGIFNCR